MSLQCLRLTGNDILNELPKVLILMQLKFLSHRTRAFSAVPKRGMWRSGLVNKELRRPRGYESGSASGRTAGPGGSIQGSGALCSRMSSVCVGEGPPLLLPKGSSLNHRIRPIQGLGPPLPDYTAALLAPAM